MRCQCVTENLFRMKEKSDHTPLKKKKKKDMFWLPQNQKHEVSLLSKDKIHDLKSDTLFT